MCLSDGLGLPVEEWQAAIQSQLDKIRKLEENYEAELTGKKVSAFWLALQNMERETMMFSNGTCHPKHQWVL